MTALYLAASTLALAAYFLFAPPSSFEAWRSAVSQPAVRAGLGLFLLSLLVHAWVGVRDILMDYVWPTPWRLVGLSLVALVLAGCGVWGAGVLLRVPAP